MKLPHLVQLLYDCANISHHDEYVRRFIVDTIGVNKKRQYFIDNSYHRFCCAQSIDCTRVPTCRRRVQQSSLVGRRQCRCRATTLLSRRAQCWQLNTAHALPASLIALTRKRFSCVELFPLMLFHRQSLYSLPPVAPIQSFSSRRAPAPPPTCAN